MTFEYKYVKMIKNNIGKFIMDKLIKFEESYDLENYEEILDNIIEKINYAVNVLVSNKPMFKAEDFIYYNYDEYRLNTNNNIYNPINVYVCLNKKENVKTLEKKYSKTVAPSLHFELYKFREELFDILVTLFDESFLLTKDKYGIKISNKESMAKLNLIGQSFYIVPCVYYVNDNNINGVLFYTNNRKFIDINYPEKAISNFYEKDEATNGLCSKYIRLFKNIYMKYYDLIDLPFDMFEVLFYNVPNELYKEVSFENAKNILENLMNQDLKNLKTIDEQDLQFNSKYKSLSKLYAKRVIKTLYKLISNPQNKFFD